MIRYFTAEEILLVHSLVIDETGGSHGVRDRHAILSLVEAPKQKVFGKELYKTVFEKSALYIRNIIHFHPFVDGNKRTAMTLAGVFLDNNNFFLSVEKDNIEIFALRVVSEKLEIMDIAIWLEKHSARRVRKSE